MLFCSLLFSAFSTAQAAHLHRLAPPEHKPQAHAPAETSQTGDQGVCPLCAAAHSAVLAVNPVLLGTLLVLEKVVFASPEAVRLQTWHFARLSRPPPSASQA